MRQLLFQLAVSLFLAGGIQNPNAPSKPTIPEFLRTAGQSVTHISTVASGPTPPLALFLKDVDVAVRGTVGGGISYLSEDQREVFTDYEILQPVYLFERRVVTAQRPGPAPRIKVTLRGGSVQIGEFSYTEDDQTLPLLERGQHCVFLLTRDGQRYKPVGVYYGVFKIDGDGLIPLVKDNHFAPEYERQRASGAITDIVARLIASRK